MNLRRMRGVLALVLCLVMTAFVGCTKTPTDPDQDPSNHDTKDVPALSDFDPEQEYTMPDLSQYDMTQYIKLGKYRNLSLTLKKSDITITDEAFEERVDTIIRNHSDAIRVTDRPVAWGDTVIVSYVGKIDGTAFDNGSAEDQELTLDEETAKSYIPGFIRGMEGAMPGEPVDVAVQFPESFRDTTLAGKDAVFTITVSCIVSWPEMTDEYVAELTDQKYTSAELFLTELRKDMETEAYDNALYTALWNKISENAAVLKYDRNSVLGCYSVYYNMYSFYAKYYGLTYESYLLSAYGMTPEYLFNLCIQTVKDQMVHYAVFQSGEFSVSDEEYQSGLRNYIENNRSSLLSELSKNGISDPTEEQITEYTKKTYETAVRNSCLDMIVFRELGQSAKVTVTEDAK